MMKALRYAIGLALCIAHIAGTAQADGAGSVSRGTGLDNPTLAYNLSAPRDWGAAQPFIDLMRVARPWVGHAGQTWAALKHEDLVARGVFDADGWPMWLPEDVTAIGTIFAWDEKAIDGVAATRRGVYELRFDGAGEIAVKGDAEVLSRGAGYIRFANRRGAYIGIDITATDPHGTGNYIRNITLMRAEHVALFDAGAVFSPAWLAHIKDARQIRFMDWMGTNGSPMSAWSDMPRDTARGMGWVVSVETMVRLANEIGAEPWFTMPHGATPDFNRAFATYVRDHLDPRLAVRVEYSNEVWNGAFAQHKAVKDAAQAAWGTPAVHDYYTKKAVETARIWEEVFGEQAQARLINVLAGQAISVDQVERILTPAIWKRMEPDTYVDPREVFEEVAIASYFGGHVLRDEAARGELAAKLKQGPEEARAWMRARLLDPEQTSGLPHVARLWRNQAALVHKHGLRLVAYEGGQHIHFAAGGRRDADPVDVFLIDYMRSEDMEAFYDQAWEAWAAVADGPVMHYNAVSLPAWYGSWGGRAFVGDETPRARLLDYRNTTSQPWWDAQPCACFLNGVTRIGPQSGVTLTGTDAADILVGGRGDDVFHSGGGVDHIDGGEGVDEVVLSGVRDAYTVTATAQGHQISGPDGIKSLRRIERLRFASGVMQFP
ncbi:hypothetical protein [Celeribacter sp.]|uniref:hypothetical protein n=1 Tax=Celeribacter sp. TaxID=1890673 RepID=UPI003A922BEA